jgi:hypothetical protein
MLEHGYKFEYYSFNAHVFESILFYLNLIVSSTQARSELFKICLTLSFLNRNTVRGYRIVLKGLSVSRK